MLILIKYGPECGEIAVGAGVAAIDSGHEQRGGSARVVAGEAASNGCGYLTAEKNNTNNQFYWAVLKEGVGGAVATPGRTGVFVRDGALEEVVLPPPRTLSGKCVILNQWSTSPS
jgi:hypothetical protein